MPGPAEFDVLASSLRADAQDTRAFVDVLATKLEEAIPGRVEVERKGGLLARRKQVGLLRLALDEHVYELAVQRGGVDCRRRRVVGGITLKSETLDLDAWIASVSADLADLADRSERDRLALERLLSA